MFCDLNQSNPICQKLICVLENLQITLILFCIQNIYNFYSVAVMESEVIKEKIHTEPMLNDPRYITLLSVIVLLSTICKWNKLTYLGNNNYLIIYQFTYFKLSYIMLYFYCHCRYSLHMGTFSWIN